jgi:hypothetical protein
MIDDEGDTSLEPSQLLLCFETTSLPNVNGCDVSSAGCFDCSKCGAGFIDTKKFTFYI